MDFKKIVPHLIGIGILLAVAAIFFAPNAFGGKVLPQPDNDKARGMAAEIQHYIDTEGKVPLWTNSAFGGMPAFQIYSAVENNWAEPAFRALFLGTDYTTVWVQLFISMLCMYLLLSVLSADWRVAVFGALAYGVTSYHVDILEAGHSTKMMALAMAPGIFAGAVLLNRGRLLLGGGILALFLAMQVFANHVQITYYTLLLTGIYFLARLVEVIVGERKKDRALGALIEAEGAGANAAAAGGSAVAGWLKAAAVAAFAVALGFGSNLSKLWPTYEYSKETIRGKSSLAAKADKGDGLDKDYLFGWSYGKAESLTLLVPHFAGGGANERFPNTKTYKAIASQGGRQQAEQGTQQYLYTGAQPFVGTAIYFGAIVCFLFFLGAWLVPGSAKWWFFAGGIFMVSLAWGKNFGLNFFFYDHLPMFNKFRAVTMALGMGQLCAAGLAALALQKLCDADLALARKKQAVWVGLGTTGLLFLLALLLGGEGVQDSELRANPEIFKMIQEDRAALLKADLMRSLVFVLLAAALIMLYLGGRVKAALMVLAVAGLSLADHWSVCARTISSDDFEEKRTATKPPTEEAYDKQIKQDKDLSYRVLDLSRGGFTSNWNTSYFHKSLTGYHAAKLQRYQEVVDSVLNTQQNFMQVVGMMNGKYIVDQSKRVIPNAFACGNAWFVKNYQTVPTPEAELQGLKTLNPKDTALIEQSYAASLQGLDIRWDSANTIRLTAYHPDKMEYEYSAKTEQLAVFSEMYYTPERGWNVLLDGQPVAGGFTKANYLLRAMRLPAGDHKLEMRFEPKSFYTGEKVSLVASLLTLLAFFGGLFWLWKNGSLGNPGQLSDVERPESSRPAPPTKAAPVPDRKKGKK